jgi:hypothetical protein
VTVYMDLWGYDYDRTEALVGDPYAGDWPETLPVRPSPHHRRA